MILTLILFSIFVYGLAALTYLLGHAEGDPDKKIGAVVLVFAYTLLLLISL